jgi:hypothetical protein
MEVLLTCINSLIARFDTNPTIFLRLEQERQRQQLAFLNLISFVDEELTDGRLQEELGALADVIRLAQQEGATRIRLQVT